MLPLIIHECGKKTLGQLKLINIIWKPHKNFKKLFLNLLFVISTGLSSLGVPGMPCPPPKILADQLTLSQPRGL